MAMTAVARPLSMVSRLAEKQKAKYTYGVLERQFHNLFNKAANMDGITGEALLQAS